MATIKDVAERAGVSIATVSRVLNNAESVGETYRVAVQSAIRELGFCPNLAARSLRSRAYHTIGVIMADFSTPFFEKIIKRIETEFRANGDLVLFVNTYDDPVIERQGIEFMQERQADVILISSTGANEDLLDRVQQAGIGVIFVDRRPAGGEFPTVCADKKAGMRQILTYLEQNGHDRVAVVTGPRQLTSNYDRYAGAMDYLYENGKDPSSVTFHYGSFTEDYGYRSAETLLTTAAPPTAIVAGSAVIAAGIMRFCRERGIEIPAQLSLVSFGDLSAGELISPRLTYVTDEHKEIGRRLAGRIGECFEGRLTVGAELIAPHLCIHDSVATIGGDK